MNTLISAPRKLKKKHSNRKTEETQEKQKNKQVIS